MQLFPAVVKVFEDKLSLDDETLMKLTAGYAAGMGCLEATCRALIGAVMTAGVLTDEPERLVIPKKSLQSFSKNAVQRSVGRASAQERYSVNVRMRKKCGACTRRSNGD